LLGLLVAWLVDWSVVWLLGCLLGMIGWLLALFFGWGGCILVGWSVFGWLVGTAFV
jgi:hypothetical protein